jgi:Carboxypeptidase regulatory-like domain/TonB dependent receptor-like, beta-barrel/TonB-dependent Receptor Plug Domain
MKTMLRVLLLCSAALACAFAQTVGASLQGTVYDPSGAVVPHAEITIRNVDTEAIRTLVADEGGRWREPVLLPGDYELRVSAVGFQTMLRKGIHLAVGQDAVMDLHLDLGQTGTEVKVVADAERINLVSGAVSGLVDEKQMRDLPLNGRSFQQLALLQPGVNAVNAGGNDPVGGRTPKISINGTRPEQSSFLLDGTDINDVYNKTPGSVGGVLLGVEAVLEFQVLTNSYSSEFGRSAGGVVNAVTRSGTNQLHGSLFEFLRNSDLDAKNFFDPATQPIPPFKRNQFGGVLGGPIHKDKTFFFGSFESLIDRLGVTGVTSVPTVAARQGLLPSGAVKVNPAIQPYLDTLFPQPNGRDLGGGIAQYLFTAPQPTNEYFAQGRIDHRFSSNDSLFGRYTFDNGNVDRPPTIKVPGTNTKERSRNQYVTLEYQHVFSPSLLNTMRFGFNRSNHESVNERLLNIPSSLSWIPGQQFGYLTVSGMATEDFGDYRLPRLDRLNNWQYGDTVFLSHGAHGIKMGFDTQRIQFNQNTTSQVGGLLSFTNLSNFLQGIPSQFDFAIPGGIDPVRGYRQRLFAFFVQDDIRLRPNLTVNLGLRYEFVTVPTEVNGKISNLRHVTDPALNVGGQWYSNPSLKNFAPRVGFAWDPFSSGKTSVRGGFGMFYDEILPKYYFFSGSLNPPFTQRASLVRPSFPNLLAGFDPNHALFQLQTTNYDVQNPYAMQFNLSIQRALPGDWVVSAGYSGSRGVHLFRIGDANLAPFTVVNGIKVYQSQLGRMNPNFASITQRITDAQSFYNALQFTAQKQFSHGLRAQLSYTFSRSIDDASGINSQDYTDGSPYVLDFYDRKADRGLSAFWAKQVFVGNWSYELPFAKGMTGVGGLLLKGWQLNSITTVQTGHPFEVRLGTFNRSGNLNTVNYAVHERPDVNPAFTGNPILGGPDRYWDINAFVLQPAGQRGNLGRNTLIGPGIVNFDLSVAKAFQIDELRKFEFRGEMFNLPNHPNFSVPSGLTAFTGADAKGNGIIAANWGVISSTVTTSRQIQLGLKFIF